MTVKRRDVLAGAAAAMICPLDARAKKVEPMIDATEMAARIRKGDMSPLQAVDAAIARAETLQPRLNFMVGTVFDEARKRAREGKVDGPFGGVPYLIKDMYDVAGARTRYGARFTAMMPAATTTAPYVKAVEATGLIVIGKSSLGEIGYLPTTESLAFGPTRNPWDTTRTPGGSSGGAAAAVAAGVVPFADAADGGGSIRIPASCCGLFGLKPSRHRLVGDQPATVGFELVVEHAITRSVRDSATLFALTERKGGDLPAVGHVTGASSRRLRIGLVMNGLANTVPDSDVAAGVAATSTLLAGLRHSVEPTTWPFDGLRFNEDFATVWSAGAAGLIGMIAKTVGRQPDTTMLEPFTLAMGAFAAQKPAGAVEEAIARLTADVAAYERWFDRFDVILSPVTGSVAVPIGTIVGDTPLETLLERIDRFAGYTTIHNVAGAPAMSVPLHWTPAGMPVGLQFAARRGNERTLFELAYELEAARPWNTRRPPVAA